jgi:hypothetical protein
MNDMTEQEVLDFYNELVDNYGDSLANFEQEPRRFAFQVKLYKYYQERKCNSENTK